jgi:hypothetical protein
MTNFPGIMKRFDKAYFTHAASTSLKWAEAQIAAVSSSHGNALVTPGSKQFIKRPLIFFTLA